MTQHEPYAGVMIHIFITDDFVDWGELFLESFRFHHGEHARVRVDGLGLTEENQHLLRRVYSNADIRSRDVDWAQVSEVLGVSRETLDTWRGQIKRGIVDETNFPLKVYISVQERYRAIQGVVQEARAAGYSYVLHSDADVYIRAPFDGLFELMAEHDVCAYLRPTKKRDVMKVWGGFLGFQTSGPVENFLDRWMAEIDATPVVERWKGFGQSAIWYALQNSPEIRIGDLSREKGAPRYSKSARPEDDIWLGNSTVGGERKVIMLRRFWDDLKSGLPRVPLSRSSPIDRTRQLAEACYHSLARRRHQVRKHGLRSLTRRPGAGS